MTENNIMKQQLIIEEKEGMSEDKDEIKQRWEKLNSK